MAADDVGNALENSTLAADKAQGQIRAVESGDIFGGIGNVQGRFYIGASMGIGRGGQGQHRCIGQMRFELPKRAVVRSEVMAPLADTMRFVNGDQGRFQTHQAIKH